MKKLFEPYKNEGDIAEEPKEAYVETGRHSSNAPYRCGRAVGPAGQAGDQAWAG